MKDEDAISRELICQCELEVGDSPCPVHDCQACQGHGEVMIATWYDGAPAIDYVSCPYCAVKDRDSH